MSENPVDIALAKIAFYEDEIDRLRKFIKTANSLLEERTLYDLHKASQNSEQKASLNSKVEWQPVIIHSPTSSSAPTEIILSQAADVLRKNGKPMLAAEIFDGVTRTGIKIGGKNPKGNLTAKFALQRNVFVLDKKTMRWSLAEWAKPENKKALPDLDLGEGS